MSEQGVWQDSGRWIKVVNPELPALLSHLAEIHLFLPHPPLRKVPMPRKTFVLVVLNTLVPASLRAHITHSQVCICWRRDTGCWGVDLMAPVKKSFTVWERAHYIEPEDECKRDPDSRSPWEPRPPLCWAPFLMGRAHFSSGQSRGSHWCLQGGAASRGDSECLPGLWICTPGCWASGN